MKFIEKYKDDVVAQVMTFVGLMTFAAISLHFSPEDYQYLPFYIAGLMQFDAAKIIKSKLTKKK